MDEDRPQCVGHLPFRLQTTANGSFSILRTGTADPKRASRSFVLRLQSRRCRMQTDEVLGITATRGVGQGLQERAGQLRPPERQVGARQGTQPGYHPA